MTTIQRSPKHISQVQTSPLAWTFQLNYKLLIIARVQMRSHIEEGHSLLSVHTTTFHFSSIYVSQATNLIDKCLPSPCILGL